MPRSTMATLIARTRLLIGDPVSATQQFSDDEIQDALDVYRDDMRYMELVEQVTFQNNAPSIFLDYYDDGRGFWEDDVQLVDYRWLPLSPATSDLLTGHWTFAANQYPPVLLTGKSFDVYHTAADLLETWAALTVAASFDFSSDGQSFHKSQVPAARMKLAYMYLARARVRQADTVRTDVNAAYRSPLDGIGSGR